MGMRPIEIVWKFEVRNAHKIVVRRTSGIFTDRLTVDLDGERALDVPAGGFAAYRNAHGFVIDGRVVELRWQWSWVWGDPKAMALVFAGQLVAATGRAENVRRLIETRSRGWILAAAVLLGAVLAWTFLSSAWRVLG